MHVSRVGDETGPTHRTTSSQTRSPPVGLLTGPKCNPRDSVKLQGVTNRGRVPPPAGAPPPSVPSAALWRDSEPEPFARVGPDESRGLRSAWRVRLWSGGFDRGL